MTSVEWDPKARNFLRKLPKNISQRIFNKVDREVCKDVVRFLETLVNFEGYKIREIASMIGCGEGTVKKYLFEANHKLRDQLSELYA